MNVKMALMPALTTAPTLKDPTLAVVQMAIGWDRMKSHVKVILYSATII